MTAILTVWFPPVNVQLETLVQLESTAQHAKLIMRHGIIFRMFVFVPMPLSLDWSHLKAGHGSPYFSNLTRMKHFAEELLNLKSLVSSSGPE